jgi:hypothetical protein
MNHSSVSINSGDTLPLCCSEPGGTMKRLVLRSSRRWLVAAVALFLAVKLVWVLVPAAVMGLPRLGDDALVYLWSGVSSVVEPRLNQPAIRDIIQIRLEDASPPPALEHARARVTMRTTGVTASPVALLAGGLHHAGVSHNLAFALVEVAIAVCLCFGIAYAVGHLCGHGAAAATLALLAFAILPNQGLHYLIPSVFVLALALVLWATVLTHPARWLLALVTAIAMLLAHPIGPVYVLVGIALLAGLAVKARRLPFASATSLAALGASFPLWLAINSWVGVRAPQTSGLGGFSLAEVPRNIVGLAGHLKTLALTQPVLFVLLLVGLVMAICQRRTRPNAFLLAGVLAGVVVTTVMVDVPGYPGELPSRALIALLIICVGIAGTWLLESFMLLRRRWLLGAAVIGFTWCTQLPQFLHYGIENINSRHQTYDAAELRSEIAALPANTRIVWLDSDVALMAGLLEGADRLHAVPYSMLAKPEDLRAWTTSTEPIVLATIAPERLNGMSAVRSWSLQPRFYGFDFDSYSYVLIDATVASEMPHFLRVSGGKIGLLRVHAADGRQCQLEQSPSSAAHWLRITGCEGARRLQIESNDRNLRVTGISQRSLAPSCAWPWGASGLRLIAVSRKGGERMELSFSYDYLLGVQTARAMQSQLGTLALRSCESGIVWLQAASTHEIQ